MTQATRRSILTAIVASVLTTAGCNSPASGADDNGPVSEADVTDTATTTPTTATPITANPAILLLDGAPNGLRKYSITVTAPATTTLEAVTGKLLWGPQFQIESGGVGASTVTFRGVDLAGMVGSFENARPLAQLRFETSVAISRLELTVNTLTDDDGNEISPSRLRFKRP